MDLMKKIVFITLVSYVQSVYAQDEKQFISKGNIFYKQREYDKAAEEYKKATEKNDKSPVAKYNLGNALYKTKKPDEAVKAFDDAAENSKDKSFKSKAGYNKGVMYSRQNKFPESIQAYKEALRLNSQDEEARENLQKALNEMKKQQPPPSPKQNKQNKNDNDQNQDQPKHNNSKLKLKQAEQMLNALRQEEKKIQQNLQNKQNRSGGSSRKDW